MRLKRFGSESSLTVALRYGRAVDQEAQEIRPGVFARSLPASLT
jgi:hypothetical protein